MGRCRVAFVLLKVIGRVDLMVLAHDTIARNFRDNARRGDAVHGGVALHKNKNK